MASITFTFTKLLRKGQSFELGEMQQYDLRMGTPRAVKSQTIADLLAQFLGEEEFPLDDEVPGEVAMAKEVKEQWVIEI